MTSWPNGARCAVTTTIHFDAETLWTSRDARNSQRPVTLSEGRFGAKRGVDALLALLDSQRLRTTFFVPGAVALAYPEVVRRVLDAGHGLGHHGYAHERVASAEPGSVDERGVLEQGLEALQAIASVRPRGYAAPGWEFTPQTLELLAYYGFEYSANMMDDISPYRHPAVNGVEIVELPVHWLLDDAPFRLSVPRASAGQILKIWLEEFRGIYSAGGLFNLTLHPQVSGRPSMVQMLQRLFAELRTYPDVWFASCEQVCELVGAQADGARA